MTFPQAVDMLEYWQQSPPEHELVAMFARVYTTWKPMVAGDAAAPKGNAQQKSLEERWAAGAMNAAQIFKATGGVLTVDGSANGPSLEGAEMPGVGPFPGTTH